jgi:hypothetical protein
MTTRQATLRGQEGDLLSGPQYKVLVSDNYHYGDPDDRYEHGTFDTLDGALAACHAIVEASLSELQVPGMSPGELFHRYQLFGADPFIVVVGPAAPTGNAAPPFSAWGYARQQSKHLCRRAKATPQV